MSDDEELIAQAKKEFAEFSTHITSVIETIPEQVWKEKSWKCRFGMHSYDKISDMDIASASRYCQKCGKIEKFNVVTMLECIKIRDFMAERKKA